MINSYYDGAGGGGRTRTYSEVRQILSLVRLPVPPLQPENFSVYHRVFKARGRPVLLLTLARKNQRQGNDFSVFTLNWPRRDNSSH